MPHRILPIARVRLARSLPRLMAWPVLVIVTGAMAAGTWLVGSFGAGIGGIVFAALGGFLILVGLVVAVLLLSIRVEVEEAAVRLSWLGGERIYGLVRGPVTRVRLRGEDASRLRSRLGMFGWAVGPARLRGEEEIHVVRLAATRTAILVPTDRGRLAIAPADEEQLLDALTRAARARQRLAEVADQARPVEDVQEPVEPIGTVEVEPHVLTGIERALLEQRLAAEREAAHAAAEVERLAAAAAVGDGEGAEREQPSLRPEAGPVTEERPAARRRLGLRRPRPSAAFVLLPLVAAGAVWGIGMVNDTYPAPGTDLGRLTSLALVLAGPATSVGAIMARAWWPRLVGVVVAGGLAASVFIGRALIGG